MRRDYSDAIAYLDRHVLPLVDTLNIVARNDNWCRGGITGFAYSTGRNPTTMAHKFDPAHSGHQLNIIEMMDFMRYVTAEGRAHVLDAMHSELGDSLWFFVSDAYCHEVPACLVEGAGELLHKTADAATGVAKHIADGKVDDEELKETKHLAYQVIRAAVGLYQRARHVNLLGKGAGRE